MAVRTTARLFSLFVTATASLHDHRPPWPESYPPVVSTTSGRIHGKVDRDLPNVAQYLGIPYAAPPVEALRWVAPQPIHQPNVDIDATKIPVSCMQFLSPGAIFSFTGISAFNLQGLNRTGAISEDCLNLSIWSPIKGITDHIPPSTGSYNPHASQGLPVLIFLTAGAFYDGGTAVPYYIPAQWVNRTPNHIVVTINLRMGIFGQPNAAGLDQQNLFMLDLRLVIEWCRQNIAAFGGNPSKITMFGQSSSGMTVDYYQFAYPDDPIVSGLIMQSSTALTPFFNDDPTHSNFTFVAENVGCAGLSGNPQKQLACMRALDAHTIEDFVAGYTINATQPGLAFLPIMDDRLVFHNYSERALAGKQSRLPAILGTNAQDGVLFAANVTGFDPDLAQFWQLSLFDCPVTETIRLRQETGRLSYRYLYAGNFSNIVTKPWLGAMHGSEIPMIMGTEDYGGPGTPLEHATSHALQDAWVAFARDPVNGLAGQEWQVYSKEGEKQVREFGAGIAAQDVSMAAREAMCKGANPATTMDASLGPGMST